MASVDPPPSTLEDEEEEEEEVDASDLLPLLSWPRSTSTTAVVFPRLVTLVTMHFTVCSFVQDKAARHHGRYGPECQSSAFVVDLAVALAGLVCWYCSSPLCSFLLSPCLMLGIMAGMHHKDSYALFVSCSGLCKARFADILNLALCSSRVSAQMFSFMASMNQRDSNLARWSSSSSLSLCRGSSPWFFRPW